MNKIRFISKCQPPHNTHSVRSLFEKHVSAYNIVCYNNTFIRLENFIIVVLIMCLFTKA